MTEGTAHITRIRVRGYHLDLYGHVNNARYLEFLEEARWSFVESRHPLAWWHDQGLAFVVASININYRLPATLGAELAIQTSMARIGGRSAVVHQDVLDSGTGERVADAVVTFVIVGRETGRPVALDGTLRAALGGGEG